MIYLLAFLLAILVLVFFHELGHFLVARACGIRVLTFSIGFGPVLASFKDKRGTQYQIAAVPLGGYVRMLGEDEFSEQPEPHELNEAFSTASPPKKVAIAAAGPFASLLLAWLVFYVILVTGTRELDSLIGHVEEGSPVAIAGLQVGEEIRLVDGQETETWQQVNYALADRLGDTGVIQIATTRRTYEVPINDWLASDADPSPMAALGLSPAIKPYIVEVLPDSPADQAGMQIGDHISAINSDTVTTWGQVVNIIQENPNKLLAVTVERESGTATLNLRPASVFDDRGVEFGQAGIRPEFGRSVRYGLLEAIPVSFTQTIDLIVLSADSIYKLIAGDVHSSNLGGPVRIAEFAGDFASMGFEPYLTLLAALTIALGLINLLPIPMLDGGHVLFGLIEWISGRSVPLKVQAIGMRIGLFLVMCLMFFALYNDINRLFG